MVRNVTGFYQIPGWNDFVKDKHELARTVFLDWCANSEPKHGALFQEMCRSCADFKRAHRFFKQHKQQLLADNYADHFTTVGCKQFWK